MDWSDFYRAQAGRRVRPTFERALRLRWSVSPGDAIDLGCGDGVESRALLAAGWRVLALDDAPDVVERVAEGVPEADRGRLTVRRSSFESLADSSPPLPETDLVYAGFALPFCRPEAFDKLWAGIRAALRPGGLFAGQLFGPHDDFASWPDTNTHDRADVDRLLDGLRVLALDEEDRDGTCWSGSKHWHVFHVVAEQP